MNQRIFVVNVEFKASHSISIYSQTRSQRAPITVMDLLQVNAYIHVWYSSRHLQTFEEQEAKVGTTSKTADYQDIS